MAATLCAPSATPAAGICAPITTPEEELGTLLTEIWKPETPNVWFFKTVSDAAARVQGRPCGRAPSRIVVPSGRPPPTSGPIAECEACIPCRGGPCSGSRDPQRAGALRDDCSARPVAPRHPGGRRPSPSEARCAGFRRRHARSANACPLTRITTSPSSRAGTVSPHGP